MLLVDFNLSNASLFSVLLFFSLLREDTHRSNTQTSTGKFIKSKIFTFLSRSLIILLEIKNLKYSQIFLLVSFIIIYS